MKKQSKGLFVSLESKLSTKTAKFNENMNKAGEIPASNPRFLDQKKENCGKDFYDSNKTPVLEPRSNAPEQETVQGAIIPQHQHIEKIDFGMYDHQFITNYGDYQDKSDDSDQSLSAIAEYECWVNSGISDRVSDSGAGTATSTRNKPPHGVADNEHPEANQPTCERGRTMYENDTSTPARGVPPYPVESQFSPEKTEETPPLSGNHSAFSAKKVIHADSRYMLEPASGALDKGETRLAVKGDMKSGKTTMLAEQVRKQPVGVVSIVVISLRSLCQATARNLSRKSGRDVVDYESVNPSMLPDAIVTTFNSLPKIATQIGDATIHILAFDEIESGAHFMANGTIRNKSEAAGSIQELESRAKIVLLMDAHIGAASLSFTRAFMPSAEFTLLLNHYQTWGDYSYAWHEGKKAGISLVVDYIERGLCLWVTCSSAELAEKLHIALSESGVLDSLKVLAAYNNKTENESPELAEAKADNSKFKRYQLVIASPAVGVGMSVEGEHFDRTVAFMVQDKRTPDAVASMQHPFRARDLKHKHIDLVHVDQSGQGAPLSKFENARDAKTLKDLKNKIIDSAATDAEKAAILKDLACLHIIYEQGIDDIVADDFPRYRQIITDEFKAKGIREVSPEQVGECGAVIDAMKEAPAIIEAKRSKALIDAPLVNEEEADTIRDKVRRGRGLVSNSERLSLEKYGLVRAYHFDDTPPTESQLHEYLELRKSGIATGRNNIARALMSVKDINRLQVAYTVGAGVDETFRQDAASNKAVSVKALWQVDRLLCDLVGISRDGDMCRIDSPDLVDSEALLRRGLLRKESVTEWLSRYADGYNATKPERRINRRGLSKDPLETVRALISSRLKLSTSKLRGVDAFVIDDEQPVIDNFNSQMDRGSFGDLKVLDRIHAIESLIDGDSLSSELRVNLGIDAETERFLMKGLSLLPKRKQNSVLPEYLRRASLPRPTGDQFTPLARANQYLLDACNTLKIAV